MGVEYAVDSGRPAVVLASETLADALSDAAVPEAEQSLHAELVDATALEAAIEETTAECVVLTVDDPLDPIAVSATIPVVYYAPRGDLEDDRVREIAAAADVDYVPANDDVGDNALLRSRVTERVAAERLRDDREIRTEALEQAGVDDTVASVDDDDVVSQYVGIQSDVTETVAAQRAHRRMVELTADPDTDFEAKVDALLELGRERFDVDVGFLSAIDDELEVVAADSAHPGLQPGATEPLSTTYCRRTVAADEPLAVEDAAEEWGDDPAYDRWELACYVGAKVEVDGELYGTLCFADTGESRAFTDAEKTFVELLATWVRYELERRERERSLKRENERLSKFASAVSHDLRNPLGIAQGHLQVLRAGDADDETVDEVATALDRMEALIEDVLSLARDGEVVDDPEVVSLAAAATEAVRVVDAPDVTLDVPRDAPNVRADPERVRTTLENLFRNSIEHGDATTIRIGVDDDVLSVADDGTGIPVDDRENVFEHGFTTDEDGTGFGLAIVEEIADAHGWSVSLTESDTGGARFEFHGVDVVDD